MAVVSVAFDGTRVSAGDSLSSGGFVWTTAGATATKETDYYYQGTASISCQVKTADVGMWGYHTSTSYNYTTNSRVWLAKVIQTNKDAIDGNGLQLEISSSNSSTRQNYYYYYVYSATTYPISGGWQIFPINPNISGYRTGTSGSPVLSTVYSYGIRSDAAFTAKAPNLGIDAVDFIDNGTGLTLTGGDSTSTDGTFDSFVTADEGTQNNRWGVVQTKDGIIYVRGTLVIGTAATAAGFTDSNRIVVFPSCWVGPSFCGLKLNLTKPKSVSTFTSCTFIGRGLRNMTSGDTDNRPDLTITGDSGTASFSYCKFQNFNNITLSSTTTIQNSTIALTDSIKHGDTSASTKGMATLSYNTFDLPSCLRGQTFLLTRNLAKISNCTFNSSGTGHAIEILVGDSYDFTNNTFTGYAADVTGDSWNRAIYNNSGDTVIIKKSGGTTPSIRNGTNAYTVVSSSVPVEITVVGEQGDTIAGAQLAIFITSTMTNLINTDTDSTGKVSTTYTGSTPIGITVRVRKASTGANKYIPYSSTATISGTGLSATVTLVRDTINSS